MLYPQEQFVTNASMAVAVASNPINVNLYFGYAIFAKWTTSGTLGGTLALSASVNHVEDNQGNVRVAGDFVPITGTAVNINAAGSFLWNVPDANYSYVKLIYTPAVSDSGTLNAFFTKKGF